MADEIKKPQTINEEAKLPDNWVPVDTPPIIPGKSGPGNDESADGSSKYLQGSLPPGYQHDSSFVGTGYKGGGTPALSLMPLGLQGNPSTNAAIQSTAKTTINNNPSPTPAVTAAMNFRGTWTAFTQYGIDDVVIFNLSAYVALQVNVAQQPDNNPTQWELLSENLVFNPTIAVTPAVFGFKLFDSSAQAAGGATPMTAGPLTPSTGNGWAILGNVNNSAHNGETIPGFTSIDSDQIQIGVMPISSVAPVSVSKAITGEWCTNLALFTGNSYPLVAGVTQLQVASNLLTVTCTQNFAVGTQVSFISTNLGNLNGHTVTILSNNGTSFTANFTNADYGPAGDSGTATNLPYLQAAAVDGPSIPASLTFPNPVKNGSTIVVAVMSSDSNAKFVVTSITDGVNSYTIKNVGGVGTGAAPFGYANMAWAANVTGGALTVLMNGTTTTGTGSMRYVIFEFPGGASAAISHYVPYDVLNFRGSTFVCLTETTSDPLTSPSSWAMVAQGTGGADAITGTYTAVANDYGRLKYNATSSSVTLKLPAVPPKNQDGSGSWWIAAQATSTGNLVINPNGLLLDGSGSNLTIGPAMGILIYTDGVNYFTMRGLPPVINLAVGGSGGVTGILPEANGGTGANLSATGGPSQVLKQTTVGGAVTVGQEAFTDISGTATTAQMPASVLNFSAPSFAPGLGTANQKLLRIPLIQAVKFLAGAANSRATASVAATGSTTFTLSKNGTPFATVNFATSSATGVWTQAADSTFAIGDVLEVDGPALPDASLADVGINLAGVLQ